MEEKLAAVAEPFAPYAKLVAVLFDDAARQVQPNAGSATAAFDQRLNFSEHIEN